MVKDIQGKGYVCLAGARPPIGRHTEAVIIFGHRRQTHVEDSPCVVGGVALCRGAYYRKQHKEASDCHAHRLRDCFVSMVAALARDKKQTAQFLVL